mgnify:CR=1 FL=1
MKKIVMIIVAMTIIYGCNKAPMENTNNNIKKKKIRTIDDEDKYDLIIETITYGLLNLSNNSNFRDIVLDEVGKKFDEDDNVLLKTVSARCALADINLYDEMASSLTQYDKEYLITYLDEAINGFDYFDEVLYPQIYIPFIELQNTSTVPKLCMNKNDDDTLPIYYLSSSSALMSSSANEDYASNNYLWVISVNETVNSAGEINESSMVTSSKGTRASGDRFLEINKIYINEKKEGWGNGRADISHATRIYRPGSGTIDNQTSGIPFAKISNAQLNTWINPSLMNGSLKIVSNAFVNSAEWEENYSEQLKTLLFEVDRRTTFARTEVLFTATGGTIYYRSKETPYGVVQPAFSDFNLTGASSTKDFYLGVWNQFRFNGYKF